MTIKLKDLIRNKKKKDRFFKEFDHKAEQHIQFQEVEENRYYEELGNLIEKHPICNPRVRRG